MNLFENDRFSLKFSTSSDEDILIRRLLLSHDPDGRSIDSEQLLRAMENVMCYSPTSEVSGFHIDATAMCDTNNIEVVGSQEMLGQIICKITCEVSCKCSGQRNLHAWTMILFDLLGNYRWDAKVVLILAAFATNYGEFWLIMQLFPCNPLAVSVAMLKHLPSDLSTLKPQFKALQSLIRKMVDVTKCIIKFEGLPLRHVKLDGEAIAITKSSIYIAAYWVTRSALVCSSQIKELTAMKPEQVLKFNNICSMGTLKSGIQVGQHMWSPKMAETKMYQKLLDLFQEAHEDNQKVLGILLALKDGRPLRDSSTQAQLGVTELKDKIVVLLFSKPELLPLEGLLLLVQQTYDHPDHRKLRGSYEIVWVPISASDTWTGAEKDMFKFLSNSLPWYSVRQPWALNSAVVNYIRKAWNYKDDPIMVVLDSQGMVANPNAVDMILIWGPRACPFSSSRENELWEEEKNWTLQLLVDQIDPLLTGWVEEGRNICLYGGDNLDWIREFNAKLKEIRKYGVQLEMVYVGSRNLSEYVRHILDIINEEMHKNLLSFTKLNFFWLRLESMRRSRLRWEQVIDSDYILEKASALLDANDKGWALVGRGTAADTMKLQGREAMECLTKFPEWGENVTKLGFLGALKTALEPPSPAGPCTHSKVVHFTEGLIEGMVVCDKCKRAMKKYIVYE